MAYTGVRFGIAVLLGMIITISLIYLMKGMITRYDTAATQAVMDLFTVDTIELDEEMQEELDYIRSRVRRENSRSVTAAAPDNSSPAESYQPQTEALREILRKKQEMISILEEQP